MLDGVSTALMDFAKTSLPTRHPAIVVSSTNQSMSAILGLGSIGIVPTRHQDSIGIP